MSQYLRTFFISDIYRPESVLSPADVFASLDPSQPDGRAPPSYVAEGGHGHRRQYRFRQDKIEMY